MEARVNAGGETHSLQQREALAGRALLPVRTPGQASTRAFLRAPVAIRRIGFIRLDSVGLQRQRRYEGT
jgi:hypothetical protein